MHEQSAGYAVSINRIPPIWMGIILLLSSCLSQQTTGQIEKPEMKIQIFSDAFIEGGTLPIKYTCDGEKVSPQLSWTDVPTETVSLVLIMDDPDAPSGTFDHWVLFNIETLQTSLPEGFSPRKYSEGLYNQGKNGFGRDGYGPPCPPKGSTHRYFFKLFALNQMIDLPSGSSRIDVEKRMEGKILATGQIMGIYGR